jgi:gas vesicle protein
MEKSTSPVVVIGALLLGAVIGGALGVLFAPDKGCETRKKLLGAGKGTTDDLEKKLSDFLAELRKETETITEKVKERV